MLREDFLQNTSNVLVKNEGGGTCEGNDKVENFTWIYLFDLGAKRTDRTIFLSSPSPVHLDNLKRLGTHRTDFSVTFPERVILIC